MKDELIYLFNAEQRGHMAALSEIPAHLRCCEG